MQIRHMAVAGFSSFINFQVSMAESIIVCRSSLTADYWQLRLGSLSMRDMVICYVNVNAMMEHGCSHEKTDLVICSTYSDFYFILDNPSSDSFLGSDDTGSFGQSANGQWRNSTPASVSTLQKSRNSRSLYLETRKTSRLVILFVYFSNLSPDIREKAVRLMCIRIFNEYTVMRYTHLSLCVEFGH